MEKEGSDVFKYENEDQVPLERQVKTRQAAREDGRVRARGFVPALKFCI